MKLINQSAQYLAQEPGIDGVYKAIELAGRTSYLSWDKMTDVVSFDLSTLPKNITVDDIPDYKLHPKECIRFLNDNKISYHVVGSSKKFVDMLIKSKHTSVLEHGTVYLRVGRYAWDGLFSHIDDYRENPYSNVNSDLHGDYYITTNLRVLQEHGWLDDLECLCEPTEFHEKRLSVKVITDIGVTREFNRHRTFSIVEQSTRYCNFSKDKFNNEITFIIPYWLNIHAGEYQMGIKKGGQIKDCYNGDYVWINNTTKETLFPLFAKYSDMFLNTMWNIERMYMEFINKIDGVKEITPQQARQVLPLSAKTEVVYTAFESDWRHFFDLRLFGKTGEPHPQIKQLAELIKQEFEKAGVWEGIMKYPSKYE